MVVELLGRELSLGEVNKAPVATLFVARNGSLSIDLRNFVSDAETADNQLVYEMVQPPKLGTIAVPDPTNRFSVASVPAADYVGAVTIRFRVFDARSAAPSMQSSRLHDS